MKENMINLYPDWRYLDLAVYQAGYSQDRPGLLTGPFVRVHYLFCYIISGGGTLIACCGSKGEETYHIHRGQGFLVFPSQTAACQADQVHPWEYVWIEFDGMCAQSVIQESGLEADAPVYHSDDKTLTKMMEDAMLELVHKSEDTQYYKISKLYEFADCLVRSSAAAKKCSTRGTLSDYYLKAAFSYIAHNYMNPISVESIARQCNIHRNRLLKIFKDHTGMSPREYLITYRMSKAAQLLVTTQLPVSEIGTAAGYPNQLHFSRAFKHVYGMPPRQYRETNRDVRNCM